MIDAPSGADGRIAWQTATIVAKTPLTPRITSFALRLARPFAFRAGQHVDIRLTAEDGYQALRSYSIASAPPASDLIELAVERLDDGEVSGFLHDVAAVGDAIDVRGPLGGHFVWPLDDDGPLLLAGGGSGVVPLLSMARHRHRAHDTRPVLFVYSARTSRDLLAPDELFAMEQRADGFILTLVLTRDPPTREGDFGRRIDAAMMAAILARSPAPVRTAFVCGSNAFVDAVAESAVLAGIPATSIRTERYGA